MILTLIDRFGEVNPQLFRELKGRWQPRNLFTAAGISLGVQVLIYLYYRGALPVIDDTTPDYDYFNRYCIGNPPPGYSSYGYSDSTYCVKDLLGDWMLNWQLWWLDIFTCLSLIGIFTLLIAGTWMLISDLSREERRGTLNFIRLSPRSAKSILIGKMLGVPAMIYLTVGLTIPLHLIAGLSARIPLSLILAFYVVVAASCAFFYSAALLFGLVATGLGGFQAWLGSGMVLFFLCCLTSLGLSGILTSSSPLDGLAVLYPGMVLPYLVHATYLPPKAIGYFAFYNAYSNSSYNSLGNLIWYGQSLWRNPLTGFGFILLNYGLWIYWIGQGIKRRFHKPLGTWWSKGQSYLISSSFAAVFLGFTLQSTETYRLRDGFYWLQVLTTFLFLILIAGLSSQRQILQDWARYRHQNDRNRWNLLKDLIWGEQSPFIVAIAINLAIVTAFTLPAIWLFPLGEYKMSVLGGTLFNVSVILIYSAIAQLMLMMKTQKRTVWAATTILAAIVLPLAIVAIFGSSEPSKTAVVGLFSLVSAWAVGQVSNTTICLSLLAQWLAIAVLNFQIVRQLSKAGESTTKMLTSDRRDRAIEGQA